MKLVGIIEAVRLMKKTGRPLERKAWHGKLCAIFNADSGEIDIQCDDGIFCLDAGDILAKDWVIDDG